MGSHSDRAAQLFREGYNCSQAVLCAFCDVTGLTMEQSQKLASAFGGGIGRLREICGAASAMVMVLGMKYGYTDMNDLSVKKDLYTMVQTLMRDFEQRMGSYQCRILLGGNVSDSPVPSPRTEEFYQTRPCQQIITRAAEMLDEFLATH